MTRRDTDAGHRACIKCGLSHDPEDPHDPMAIMAIQTHHCDWTDGAADNWLVWVHERCLQQYRGANDMERAALSYGLPKDNGSPRQRKSPRNSGDD